MITRIPPVWGIALMLCAGVGVPFMLDAGQPAPDALAVALAKKRLKAYAPPRVDASPAGEIHVRRPAFLWPADPDAASYEFTLLYGEEDAVWLGPRRVEEPRFLLPPPGRLETGTPYRFVVRGLDADGHFTGREIRSAFVVKGAPGEPRAESAFARAGVYAEKGSVHDVASSLLAFLREGPGEGERKLAEEVLRRIAPK